MHFYVLLVHKFFVTLVTRRVVVSTMDTMMVVMLSSCHAGKRQSGNEMKEASKE